MQRVVLALAMATMQTSPAASLALELRVFNGPDDVTRESRVAVYRAGERADPLARSDVASGSLTFQVPAGFYDVQAFLERDGRVMAIRWAERLVVMAYPDEGGRHLEVINLKTGFGALQVRAKPGEAVPDVAIYVSGVRDRHAAARLAGEGYALFVVPSGSYDLLLRGARPAWHTQIDVPADRTRLWFADVIR
jgi:hypothetical protein